MKTLLSKQRQGGFTLAVALLIVGTLAGVLASVISSESGKSLDAEARIVGWQAVEIGRAVRLHVRNAIENPDPAFPAFGSNRQTIANAINAGLFPAITVQNLINENLLPLNFANLEDVDSDGTLEFVNALGQEIIIIVENYPLGGDPADETTVPTAFVYFVSRTASVSAAILTQDIIQGARAEGTAVAAPLFNGLTNASGVCDKTALPPPAPPHPLNTGGNAVVLWDSGCLDENEFFELTGDTFVPGSFVLPAWRTVNFDSRAIMRFPQPEQTNLQTMQTDLVMANLEDCTTNTITVPSDSGDIDSGLCDAMDDDTATLIDNRRDILNLNNLEAANLIIEPQGTSDDVFTNDTGVRVLDPSDRGEALFIGGNLDTNGDTKVFEGDATIAGNLVADRNIIVSGSGITTVRGNIEARTVSAEEANITGAVDIEANISVNFSMDGVQQLSVGNELVTQTARSNSSSTPVITVDNGNASFLRPLSVSDNISVSGTSVPLGEYGVTAAKLQPSGNTLINGNLNVEQSIDIINIARNNVTEVTESGNADCFGDCPLRTEAFQCQALVDAGTLNSAGLPLTFEECMTPLRP